MMDSFRNEPIAIIGSACRFAGNVTSPGKLWELLKSPRDVLKEIPSSRFNPTGYYHPDAKRPGHTDVRASYLLEQDLGVFDAKFFGMKPIEAKATDPQGRILLEVVYEGLEAAGQLVESLRGSDTSVYVGLMFADYELIQNRDLDSFPNYMSLGTTSRATAANRISYNFDWSGPSMTVDTACSSSLVAVHLAVQSLRSGESRIALACGTNLILGPETYVAESKLNMLSPDGRSRMWDAGANGYARGEGVAALVLKTLRVAIQDGDHIECIIRETGVNQDGATTGMMMPSASAQRDLIRATYEKAGLESRSSRDRCQYFEAHGTGTPTGDPLEAEALKTAFFEDQTHSETPLSNGLSEHPPLYVGSVKTILGHTEGAAGIAAIIKASLAVQNGYIPPNLLFRRLNPAITPWYDGLEVPTALIPWPEVADSGDKAKTPRRASVNSFGFGGTNAHCIIESFDPKAMSEQPNTISSQTPGVIPFVLSAASEKSLISYLASFVQYLEHHGDSLDERSLAWTLYGRRSAHPFRITFPVSSIKTLRKTVESVLQAKGNSLDDATMPNPIAALIHRQQPRSSRRSFQDARETRILGVFTGQGAQYARMGAELLERSHFCRGVIRKLEGYLADLPVPDRPEWSLETELLAESPASRLGEAEIAQPLTTAVQILIVKLLCLANISLAAVVGHSSGEIAAAYAAGFLSERDAILVAYYRGFHSKLPPDSTPGAMLAVATTLEDATELCSDPSLVKRVNVAASNSSSSVTLSGDEDAIAEVEVILGEEKKWFRRLRVDRAYHSHHMHPCAESYVRSLQERGVRVLTPDSDSPCVWTSSVYEDGTGASSLGDAEYWAANMIRPVFFCQAMERTLSRGTDFDAVLEIGPHAALKGPASQNIQETLGRDLPYTGALDRKMDSITAFSSMLGLLWERLECPSYDLAEIERIMSNDGPTPKLLKNLPSYHWDHDSVFWHESRRSLALRRQSDTVHPLLGHLTPDSCLPHRLSWKNVLRISDLPWIADHSLQNQPIFPASGFLVTALEASKTISALAPGRQIQLIQLEEFSFLRFMVFEEDGSIETLVSVSDIEKDENTSSIRAKFSYEAAIGQKAQDLTLMASGNICLQLGQPSAALLQQNTNPFSNAVEVDAHLFYSALENVGYNYRGDFSALSELKRKLGRAAGRIRMPSKAALQPGEEAFLIHPACLDNAFQSLILSSCYPRDGGLWNVHVPVSMSRLQLNPVLLRPDIDDDASSFLHVEAFATAEAGKREVLGGDVVLCTSHHPHHAAVRIEGLKGVPMTPAAAKDYRKLFYRMDWGVMDFTHLGNAVDQKALSDGEKELSAMVERVATFYARKLDREVPLDHPARSEPPLCHWLRYCHHVSTLQEMGKHLYAGSEWLNDTEDDIMRVTAQYADTPDIRMLHIVGQQMPHVLRGETTILEHMRRDNLLDDFYVQARGFKNVSKWMSNKICGISHRYPRMNILEVGAGTGGATNVIVQDLEQSFASYTFTDISASFFEEAAASLRQGPDGPSALTRAERKLVFKTLDISSDPALQGFIPHTYDMVVAFLVLHVAPKLEDAISHVRTLLRPGGFLVVTEITSIDHTWPSFTFGTLPGWWAGAGEGRTISAGASASEWDAILRRSGFSGIELRTPESFQSIYGSSAFVTQFLDDCPILLRNPSVAASSVGKGFLKDLVILGGNTPQTAQLTAQLETDLRPFCGSIGCFRRLEDVSPDSMLSPFLLSRPGSMTVTVLNLLELEQPIFANLTAVELQSLKAMLREDRTLLWVTTGLRGQNPFNALALGFTRVATSEVGPGLRVQFLDFETAADANAKVISDTLIRLQLSVKEDGMEASSQGKTLWSTEPVITVDADGQQLIPRLKADAAANDRYNSRRITTTRRVDIDECPVVVDREPDGCTIVDFWDPLPGNDRAAATFSNTTVLTALKATFSALPTPLGPQFLVLGIDVTSGRKYLALSEFLASEQRMLTEMLVAVQDINRPETTILSLAAAQIIAKTILREVFPGQTVWIFGATTPQLAQCVAQEAKRKGVETIFIITKTLLSWSAEDYGDLHPNVISIPPGVSRREIQRLLLGRDPSIFWGLADWKGAGSDLELQCFLSKSCLPAHCTIHTAKSLFSRQARHIPPESRRFLDELLSDAAAYAMQHNAAASLSGTKEAELDVINVEEIATAAVDCNSLDYMAIVSWPAHDSSCRELRAQTAPADRGLGASLLRSDRTYWLVGLSGTLGLSVCDWMVQHGAKHLVITSRNPGKIDSRWIQEHENAGVRVETLACTVSDEDSLGAAYHSISKTMPELAGVLFGPLLLRDVAVRNMELEDVTEVLETRVWGAWYLDRLLHNQDLDFFVLFSSCGGLLAFQGQANYGASNTFLDSLAAHRRMRGLAASVVDLGLVMGVGYTVREDASVVNSGDVRGKIRTMRGNLMLLSETDVHAMVAEAIRDGRRPLSKHLGHELVSGIHEVYPGAEDLPTWHDNPIFANLMLPISDEDVFERSYGGLASRAGLASISERLAAAETEDHLCSVVRETLAVKLRTLLQMDVEDGALMQMRSDNIGVDSLVAVDVRSWIAKNFDVKVPVLQLMRGILIDDLVERIARELPATLVPLLRNQSSGQSSQGTPETDPRSDEAPTLHSDGTTGGTTITSMTADIGPGSKLAERRVLFEKNLSFTQSLFWTVHSIDLSRTALNHTSLLQIRGPLRVKDFSHSVQVVGERHEALRTCITTVDHDQGRHEKQQRVVQRVLADGTLRLEQYHIRSTSDLDKEFQKVARHAYDTAAGQVARVCLLTTSSPNIHYVLIGFYQLNFDGYSHQLMLNDIQRVYSGQRLDPNVLQYSSHAEQQKQEVANGDYDDDIKYWKGIYTTLPQTLPLTRCRISSRLALSEIAVNTAESHLDTDTAMLIHNIAREHDATTFHFLLATFKILIHRVTTATDFSIGVADAGRKDSETLAAIGNYINMIPLRFSHEDGAPRSFSCELREAARKTRAGLAHSSVPFEALLNALGVPRSSKSAPLFQTLIDYLQFPGNNQPFGKDCTLDLVRFAHGKANYDLSLGVVDYRNQGIRFAIMGQAHLYSQSDVQAIANLFESMLSSFSKTPGACTNGDWNFPDADIERGLRLGRGERFPSSLISQPVSHLFETVSAEHKEQPAVFVAGSTEPTTYGELHTQMDMIATALLEHVVVKSEAPGLSIVAARIAVWQEPGPGWVASMLAILKIGAVYVPLDPSVRDSRLAAIIDDCKPAVVLVDATTRERAGQLLGTGTSAEDTVVIVDISALSPTAAPGDSQIPVTTEAGDAPAAIFYTSGSTGRPKGVALGHLNLRLEVEASRSVYGLGADVRVLQQSSLAFDMSMQQILLGICLGGSLVVVPSSLRSDLAAVADFISLCNVTFSIATPTEMTAWSLYGKHDRLRTSSWKVAVMGGEAAPAALLASFRRLDKADLHLFFGYGPTETTCSSTKGELNYKEVGLYPSGQLPSGYPSHNERIYILQPGTTRLLPPGLPGEIVIGGDGVAIGYLHDTLNKGAFELDPFFDKRPSGGRHNMMYRTKDRGRLLDDGRLLLEGRIDGDTEVKLRGQRLNLSDVEKAIVEAGSGIIAQAVVSIRSDPRSIEGHKSATESQVLVGHVVLANKLDDSEGEYEGDTASHLKALLKRLPLPEYMCPAMLQPVGRLPTTTTGKLDRAAIGALAISILQPLRRGESDEKPMSDTAAGLRNMWLDALSGSPILLNQDPASTSAGVPAIDIDSEFFYVGGNSILLLKLRQKISLEYGVSLSIKEMFEASRLGAMANLIERKQEAASGRLAGSCDQLQIDWEAETAPVSLQNLSSLKMQPGSSHADAVNLKRRAGAAKVVVLTGATGLLGKRILQLLQDSPVVEKVICIGVRHLRERLDAGKLQLQPRKVEFYAGHLRAPNLGLSPADSDAIFGQADVIIHNGAEVSLLQNYDSMRAANVGSTRDLVRLSLYQGRHIPIHYVSTVGVFVYSDRAMSLAHANNGDLLFGRFSASAFPPAVDTPGYESSKWASEQLLERCCEKYKMCATIHRPSGIVRPNEVRNLVRPPVEPHLCPGDGKDVDEEEEGELAGWHLLQNLLKYSRKTKVVPEIKDGRGPQGDFDFVYLDTVATTIVGSVIDDLQAETLTYGTRYVHECGSFAIPLKDIKQYMEDETGEVGCYDEVDIHEWTARAETAGMPRSVSAAFNAVWTGRPVWFAKIT